MPTLLNSNCGCAIITSFGWEPETIAYVRVLEKRIGACNDVGDAFDVVVKVAKSGGHVVVAVLDGATTITSTDLKGKTVSLISGDGFSKGSGFTQPDNNGIIAFTDGTTLSAGNVTIFYL